MRVTIDTQEQKKKQEAGAVFSALRHHDEGDRLPSRQSYDAMTDVEHNRETLRRVFYGGSRFFSHGGSAMRSLRFAEQVDSFNSGLFFCPDVFFSLTCSLVQKKDCLPQKKAAQTDTKGRPSC